MKYVCSICGYVYDEAKEGTPFAGLPDAWACPVCGAGKSAFAVKDQNDKSGQARETAADSGEKTVRAAVSSRDGDMEKLSPGVMSAICSNLARGCEKQYKEREAALYRQIADYFASITPDEADADMEKLSGLIRNDLQEGIRYSELQRKRRRTGEPSASVPGREGNEYSEFSPSEVRKGRRKFSERHADLGLHGLRICLCGRSGAGTVSCVQSTCLEV